MKKFVAALVALLMVLGVSAAVAEDAEVPTYTCGDYEYQLLDDGTAVITKYNGDAESVEIPGEVDGYTVTVIGDGAFSKCGMTSITIPDSITSIGTNPFIYCEKLTNIVISPDHPILGTIDGVLFEKTTKTLLCYPCAFKATSYIIPNGIVTIGDRAFYNCESLNLITIPDSVTTIGNAAFEFCRGLTSITIPDSVIAIGNEAFGFCGSLTTIVIPDSVTTIGNGAFRFCQSLISIVIPDSVTTIGNDVFEFCDSLTSITIPDSVTTFGEGAFCSCASLTSITIPDGITDIGDCTFGFCDSLASIAIPDSVTTIGVLAFTQCTSLTTLTLPASVTSIGEDAFSDCPNLTLTVTRDSYAAQWCKDNGVKYTYTDANDWLNN